jgi:hypothetical protein
VSEEVQSLINRILLHYTPMWWIAEFRGPVAEEIKTIFGINMVPTGFNGCVPGPVVCQAMALLNPNAEVTLAGAVADAKSSQVAPVRALPQAQKQPDTSAIRSAVPETWSEAVRTFAAEVVGKHYPDAPAQPVTAVEPSGAEKERHSAAKRAMKIKKALGLLVACSYLREKGWSFEAAHRFLSAS